LATHTSVVMVNSPFKQV